MADMNRCHPVLDILEAMIPQRRKDETLTREASLLGLGLDSLELIQVFVQLETQLGIQVDQLEELLANGLPTVGALIDLHDANMVGVDSRAPAAA